MLPVLYRGLRQETVGALASLPAVPSINYTTQANDVFQELSRVSTLPTLPSSQLLTTRPVLDQKQATAAQNTLLSAGLQDRQTYQHYYIILKIVFMKAVSKKCQNWIDTSPVKRLKVMRMHTGPSICNFLLSTVCITNKAEKKNMGKACIHGSVPFLDSTFVLLGVQEKILCYKWGSKRYYYFFFWTFCKTKIILLQCPNIGKSYGCQFFPYFCLLGPE